jgi:hypothetical protein
MHGLPFISGGALNRRRTRRIDKLLIAMPFHTSAAYSFGAFGTRKTFKNARKNSGIQTTSAKIELS